MDEKFSIHMEFNEKVIVHIEDIHGSNDLLVSPKLDNNKDINMNEKIPFSVSYNKNSWFYIINVMIATIYIGRQVKKFIEVIFDIQK